MRRFLAALCALSLLLPAPALAAPAAEPTRRIYTPADAAREMRAAKRVPKAPPKAAKAPAKPAARRKPAPVKRAVAPARRAAWKPVRPAWRAKRPAWVGRRRWTRARAAAPAVVRRPIEPAPPVFIGDLHVQVDSAPLWSSPAGGQLLGRLPRATIVTNMGRYGGTYKVEAPNGAVGYVPMRQVGTTAPPW